MIARSLVGSLTTVLRQVELPAISLTGPGEVTPAPKAHAMLSPAPATTGIGRGKAEAPDQRRAQLTDDAPRRVGDGQLLQIEAHCLDQLGGPAARSRRSRSALAAAMRPVGDRLAGEGEREEFGRLQKEPRRGEDLGLVGANPEDLRGHVKGGRDVSGQRVQRLGAEGSTSDAASATARLSR